MGLHIQHDNSASEKALGDQENEVPAPHVDAAKRENHDKVDEMSANFSAAAPSDFKPFAVDGGVAIGGSNTAADKVTFLTAYRYATKQDLVLLAASALCAIIGGGLVPIMPVVFSQLASQFLSYDPSTSSRADFSRSTSRFTLYFVYLAIAQFVAIYGATVGFIYLGESISRKIREQYLAALLRQELAFFDQHGAGECTTRLTSDIDRIQNAIGEKFSLTVTAISTFVSAFIVGFVLCWQVMLLISWSVIVSVVAMMVGSRLSRKYRSQALDTSSRANSIVEESVTSIRDVVALAAQSRLLDCYERFLSEAESASRHLKVLLGCVLGITVGVNYLNIMIALWLGSFFLVKGDIPYTSVITIQLVITNAIFALMGISGNVEAFLTARAAADKIFKTIDRVSSLDGTSTLGLNLSHVNGVMELRGVSHAYSSRSDVKVLDAVSIIFPAGKTTALVGESGSGKSTVAALLERFYDPCEGTVLLDGHDVRKLNLRWLRQQIGLVDQQSALFDGTISENIGYGLTRMESENMTAEQRHSLIERAAMTANAHSFILDLPDGYKTRVGPRGHMLSGGQKQRISIARAIASNPKILLLDEATSALDAESEERVSAALRAAAAGRTTIVIAHRLSTVRSADNIIVLSRGRLIEQGTHEELIRLGGAYHQLVEAQEITETLRKRSGTRLTPASQENSVSPINKTSNQKEFVSINSPTPKAFPPERAELKNHVNYSTWTLIKFVAGFNKKEKGIIVIGLLCCIIAGVEESVHAILFAESTISLALPRSMAQLLRQQIEKWSLLYLALALVQMLAFCGQAIAFAWSSERLLHHARLETFRTILRQEVSFFDESNHSAGGLTTFLSTETLNLAGLSGSTLGILLIFGTTLVSAIVIALAFGWKLALVCMATIPVLLAAGYLRLSMMGKFHRRSKKAYQDSASYASAAISEIRTVASFSLEGHIWKHYHSSLLAQTIKIAKGALKTSALYALSRSVSLLCMALGFWYGSKLLAVGQYSPFQFFVVYASIIFSAKSAGMVFSFAADMGKGKQAAIDLKQLFDRPPEIDTWSKVGLHLSDVAGEVEFKDVHFSYPARMRDQVLGGLSFLIKPGEHIAIVGSSGSGKSTIMALLERFYEPTAGQILLDAKPISKLNINSYRSCMALVSQHVALFDGTIKDNLLLGVDENQVTQEDIVTACRNANILDFIMSLPDGFQTLAGPRGCMLSGGQRQRISIARALLRKSRILLLDEATSALDSESEGLIQQALDLAARDRTTITIAHRLSTVQKADRIYVMEAGQFVESGSHEDLLENRGRYWELVMLQNLSAA